jgi:hypothetical protein
MNHEREHARQSRLTARRSFQRFIAMSNTPDSPSFFSRIFSNDAARKGVAGAVAGILVAVVSEALWPST